MPKLFYVNAPEFGLILFFIMMLATLGMTVWAIIDIVKQDFKDKNGKTIWMIVVLAFSGIGPWIYLMMRRQVLAAPNGQKRNYLPPLRKEEARPQVQKPLDYDDDQYV